MTLRRINVAPLMLFGAGNFIYIAASNLIPEIKAQASQRSAALHFGFFDAGIGLMFLVGYAFRGV